MDQSATDAALLVLRLAVGLTIVAHGLNHLLGGGRLAGTGRWFESMGLRPGWLHARLATATELVGGTLLAAGAATSLAAAAVIGPMVVAGLTAHRTNGFFIFKPGQGWEYVMVLAVTAAAIGTIGPGRWSVDHAIGRGAAGWAGAAISVGAGVGGALALLTAFWRPARATD